MDQHKIDLSKAYSETLLVDTFNKGLKYLDNKKYDKAISSFKEVLKYHECKETYLNLSVAYKYLGKYDKAKEALLKACDKEMPLSDGEYQEIYEIGLNNLGLLAYTFEQDDTAEALYKTVLSQSPLNYESIWNLSLVTLRKYCSGKFNDLELAWKYYSYRFYRNGAEKLKCDKKLIPWDFINDYEDRNIVVLLEQGMGDAFMFGRYLPLLAKKFNKIYIQCTPEMDWVFKDYTTCRNASETDAQYAVPMCSLGKMVNYIPEGAWLPKYHKNNESRRLKVGCVWQGSKAHINDANRSVPVGYFKRLSKYVDLYSLGPSEKCNFMKHLPGKTWEDTANNLKELDLIISIDTSIVHFCGSIDMPCWVLMPLLDTDFRWGDSSIGYKNIWYDSVDVFRNPNNWEAVFNDLEKRLCSVLTEDLDQSGTMEKTST